LNKFQNLADKVLIPDATCYMMLKVEGDDLVIAQELANKGVVTVPGQAFGEVSKGWLRINYAVPKDKLEPALDIIINELYLY
jgi:aspartate/methionine/tyrosine aminotransferase